LSFIKREIFRFIKIKKYFSNPFLEQRFLRLKKSLTYSATDLDATDAKKEKSITFNARTGNSLSLTEVGVCDTAI